MKSRFWACLRWLAFIGCVGLSKQARAADSDWKAGLAAAKITPGKPLFLAGYAARNKPFSHVEDDLFAKALVIEDGQGQRGVILTSDLIGIAAEIAEPICERLRQTAGLARQQIVISASHTHTGPSLSVSEAARGFMTAEDAKNSAEYTRYVQDVMVDLVKRAIADLRPAQLAWGVGVAQFVMNRREFTARGGVRLGVNPRGFADRSVPVLRIAAADGKLRAVLFGCASHNTTLTQNDYVLSGDYAGHAQQWIEQHHSGVQAMFILGCAGSSNPYPRGTIALARAHGTALGKEVDRVLGAELQPVRGPLTCVLDRAELPVRQTPQVELERLAASGNVREKGSATKMLESLARGDPQPKSVSAPVAVWQFGTDLTFVGLSSEVVAEYVPLIEKAIGPLNLWVSAYCNDYFGYVPTAAMLAEGGYETLGLFRANGIFTPDTEAALVAKVREQAHRAGRRFP